MKTCICAIIKNSYNIKEFCNYYLNTIGFDKIYLYEEIDSYSHKNDIAEFGDKVILNKNMSSTLPEKYYKNNKLISANKITVIYQIRQYAWFLELYKNEYDWIAFFDDDEYLYLPKKLTLKSLLKKYKSYSALYLYWRTLRTNDIYKSDKGYLDLDFYDYTYFDINTPNIRDKVKSIVNTKLCKNINNVHVADNNGVDILYNTLSLMTNKYKKLSDIISINEINNIPYIKHFYISSFEQWFLKVLVRGMIIKYHRKIYEWFINTNIPYKYTIKII